MDNRIVQVKTALIELTKILPEQQYIEGQDFEELLNLFLTAIEVMEDQEKRLTELENKR